MPMVQEETPAPGLRGVWRQVRYGASFLLIFLLLFYIKIVYHAHQELALAEAAFTAQTYTQAITHYERTIKWYTPGSAVVRQAVTRLWQVGHDAEARGDIPLALSAYQALRSSLYAVQSVYIPYQEWIPRCEARIAPLMAQAKAGDNPDAEKIAQDTARFTMQLQRPVGAHVGWSITVELSFIGWVGATLGLIWFMHDSQGNWRPRQSLLWGSALAVCFALWAISMRLA